MDGWTALTSPLHSTEQGWWGRIWILGCRMPSTGGRRCPCQRRERGPRGCPSAWVGGVNRAERVPLHVCGMCLPAWRLCGGRLANLLTSWARPRAMPQGTPAPKRKLTLDTCKSSAQTATTTVAVAPRLIKRSRVSQSLCRYQWGVRKKRRRNKNKPSRLRQDSVSAERNAVSVAVSLFL